MPGEENKASAEDQQKSSRKKIEANKTLQKKGKALGKPSSSLPLQVLLFFDWYFSIFFLHCNNYFNVLQVIWTSLSISSMGS